MTWLKTRNDMNHSNYGIKLAGLNFFVFDRKTGRMLRKFTHVDKAMRFKFILTHKDRRPL